MKKRRHIYCIILILGIVVVGGIKIKKEILNYNGNEENSPVDLDNTGISAMDIDNTENNVISEDEKTDHWSQSDIPTIDVDSAKQIAESESDIVTEETDLINITIQDITNEHLTLCCVNTSKERMALGRIFILEFKDGEWTEIERKSNGVYELPDTVIPVDEIIRIEFEYKSLYGELDKGSYICVVEINGIEYHYDFKID